MTRYLPVVFALLMMGCHRAADVPAPAETYLEGEQIPGTEVFFPLHFYDGTSFDPVVSPDGQTIIYRRWPDNSTTPPGLYALPAAGGQPRLLVPGPQVRNAQFSPDGQWLAYNDGGQIYKLRPDGTARTLLAGPRSYPNSANHSSYVGNCFFPMWRPNGQQLAYVFSIDYRSQQGGLWLMNTDGSQGHLVCDTGALTWHPSGDALLRDESVSSTPADGTRLALFRLADCQIMQRLATPPQATTWGASYSPDGTRLLFYDERGIYVMNADGTQARRLLPNQLYYNPGDRPLTLVTQAPHWYPDGHTIVYEHFRITRSVRPAPGAITPNGLTVEGYLSLYRVNVEQALAVSTLP